MIKILITLMVLASLYELGLSGIDFKNCHSRQCLRHLEKASRKLLEIDWKPISVFPEEGKRFLKK